MFPPPEFAINERTNSGDGPGAVEEEADVPGNARGERAVSAEDEDQGAEDAESRLQKSMACPPPWHWQKSIILISIYRQPFGPEWVLEAHDFNCFIFMLL